MQPAPDGPVRQPETPCDRTTAAPRSKAIFSGLIRAAAARSGASKMTAAGRARGIRSRSSCGRSPCTSAAASSGDASARFDEADAAGLELLRQRCEARPPVDAGVVARIADRAIGRAA